LTSTTTIILAVVSDDVEFVIPAVRTSALQPGGGVHNRDATLRQPFDQIALHQRSHQFSPLTGEQLFQLIEFLGGVLKLPVGVLEQG
jgi:hypothetical protein